MDDIQDFLDEVYDGQERVSGGELHRRAVARELPADVVAALSALPDGEYAEDEVTEALALLRRHDRPR